ncbi:MAG TPA: Ada metal-binding domain-containing protein [Syntrophorhabdaceae bacterium]|jgi:AraC family transcriptional regulator of adaptative response / DNA-3-methyladenine glycosylase II
MGNNRMMLDDEACYAALRARNAGFDGRFFVGVSSTGIYCRPVCPARTPKQENCSFYASAAAAEAAGYRPCLRCRPELAPDLLRLEGESRLAGLAAKRMESDGLSDETLSGLAGSLGITDRHLRRLFVREYGAPPVAWLQTRRLLTAKRLLTDTGLSVTQVAMDAGFGSVRRLNALFRSRYTLSPTDFRKKAKVGPGPESPIALSLAYRPPLAWERLLRFFELREIAGVEHTEGSRYMRTVSVSRKGKTCKGWIEVRNVPERNMLRLSLSSSLFPVINQVLMRVRFLFDLDCSPDEVQKGIGGMRVGEEPIFEPGLRVPHSFDGFEMAVRAVMGRQITVRAARTLATRVAAHLGEPIETPFKELTLIFPSPEQICGLGTEVEDRLGSLGVTGARSRSIMAVAEALRKGEIRLGPDSDVEEEIKHLATLTGFGPWTVEYLALRALGWPDAFPSTDYGVRKALGNPPQGEVEALARTWSPWRAYALVALWDYLQKARREKAGPVL